MSNPNPNPNLSWQNTWRNGNPAGDYLSLDGIVEDYLLFATDAVSPVQALGDMTQETATKEDIITKIEGIIPQLFTFEAQWDAIIPTIKTGKVLKFGQNISVSSNDTISGFATDTDPEANAGQLIYGGYIRAKYTTNYEFIWYSTSDIDHGSNENYLMLNGSTVNWNDNGIGTGDYVVDGAYIGDIKYVQDAETIQIIAEPIPNYHYINDWFEDKTKAIYDKLVEVKSAIEALTPHVRKGSQGLKFGAAGLNAALATAGQSSSATAGDLGAVKATGSTELTDYSKALLGAAPITALELVQTKITELQTIMTDAATNTNTSDGVTSTLEGYIDNIV